MSGTLPERLEGRSVVICAGSGGVGKTTCSAAIAMGLAAQGKRVAVITIDPARRLALAASPVGARKNFRARPSKKPVRRSGASRKSRALRDGGVSRTRTSKR
ncbi:MAG: ArsA-related P-loop ATPase, partial [Solirubrobacterales bacterium]